MSRLVIDISEWTRVGSDLIRLDPKRFLALLEIAQRVVAVHEDPLSVSLADACGPSATTREPNGSA